MRGFERIDRRVVVSAVAVLLALACGPIGPIPGGALRGEVQDQQTDWSFLADVHTIQLETRPGDPHSVNTWVAGYRGNAYVPTSMIAGTEKQAERGWVKNVEKDPRVRLRIEGRVYELEAARVTDADELAAVREILIAKYEVEQDEGGQADQSWIYRMQRRGSAAGQSGEAGFGQAASEGRVTHDTEIGLFADIGDLHHPITTDSETAQKFFDQGLTLTFGFNHDAAIRSFRQATREDPDCAICWWGVALALGPNINLPMGPASELAAVDAIEKALQLDSASVRERAYIEALATRYGAEPPGDRGHRDTAYAEAMRGVYQADPSDLDAAVLFAESLMMLSPWNYWSRDKQPGEHTLELVAVLEAVLEASPNHLGANHFYIHAVEDPYPQKAVSAADRLAAVAPEDTGHLIHMPSHIFWRVGRYAEAAEINQRAAAADEDFFSWCQSQGIYDADYYPHNLHFLWAVASTEGRGDLAISTARRLAIAIPAENMERYPHVEAYLPTPLFAMARFGRWDEILGLPTPTTGGDYTLGIWHYVRGLALLRTSEAEAAQAELDALSGIASSDAMQALQFVVSPAATLLTLAELHLRGEIQAAAGDLDSAIASLEQAVQTQDALSYTEPPPWYLQNRLVLGALLLEAGRPAQADAVYRRDLEQYPKNGWALYGLSQSLAAQGKTGEAQMVASGFDNAWKSADVTLVSSRF